MWPNEDSWLHSPDSSWCPGTSSIHLCRWWGRYEKNYNSTASKHTERGKTAYNSLFISVLVNVAFVLILYISQKSEYIYIYIYIYVVCVCVCVCVCVWLVSSLSFNHVWLDNKDTLCLYNFIKFLFSFQVSILVLGWNWKMNIQKLFRLDLS